MKRSIRVNQHANLFIYVFMYLFLLVVGGLLQCCLAAVSSSRVLFHLKILPFEQLCKDCNAARVGRRKTLDSRVLVGGGRSLMF